MLRLALALAPAAASVDRGSMPTITAPFSGRSVNVILVLRKAKDSVVNRNRILVSHARWTGSSIRYWLHAPSVLPWPEYG